MDSKCSQNHTRTLLFDKCFFTENLLAAGLLKLLFPHILTLESSLLSTSGIRFGTELRSYPWMNRQ